MVPTNRFHSPLADVEDPPTTQANVTFCQPVEEGEVLPVKRDETDAYNPTYSGEARTSPSQIVC